MRNIIIQEDLHFITSASIPWETFAGKNVLISGASGFLPSYMVETLLFLNEKRFKKKMKVFALVRNIDIAKKRFEHYRGRPDLVFIVQDICQPISIKDDIHFIVHAASQASPKYYGKDPVGTICANTIGTHNLLELARVKKVESFLFFSSGEVYGEIPEQNIPIAEDKYGYLNPTLVRSCYAEGKRAGETMCISWHHQYGVPVKIVRPFHTYGPGVALEDGRVYADFVSDIVLGRNIIIKGDGKAMRVFCYIADATIAFFTVLLKGGNAGAYNVADDRGEISIKGLANMLVSLFPEKKLCVEIREDIVTDGYIKSRVNRCLPDIAKLRRLGWSPCHSMEDGFRRTIRSFHV
jgi:nucleoside-diphosphate-sugar epimerase